MSDTATEPEPTGPPFICPHCADTYVRENYYKRHVAKCPQRGDGLAEKNEEIANLESQLREAKEKALAEKRAEEKARNEERRRMARTGIKSQRDLGKYREIKTQTIDNFLDVLHSQEDEGYELFHHVMTPMGLVYMYFQKK